MTENPWEDKARNVKATRLANCVWKVIQDSAAQGEFPSITAAALPRKTWNLAAKQLQMKRPPSDKTIALAITIIEDREELEQNLRETDPFEGLPKPMPGLPL